MNASVQGRGVVIILMDRAQVLMIKRSDLVARPGIWSPPTGHVEAGESLPQAAERETLEELGIAVKAVEALWQSDTDDGRHRLHWWRVLPLSTPIQLLPNPAEVAECRWMAPADFPALKPSFEQHRAFFLEVLPAWMARQAVQSQRS
jgi:8-oxo-dGTP diphosphatase